MEHYRLILQRIDNYISGVNTKASFIIAFNVFLFGNIISQHKNIKEIIENCEYSSLGFWVLISILFLSIVSIFIVGLAIFPYLKSGNSTKGKYHSLIFFNSIADFDCDKDYLEATNKQSESEILDDLKLQIHTLSKGLNAKFIKIAWAMRLFFANLILLFLLIILILN